MRALNYTKNATFMPKKPKGNNTALKHFLFDNLGHQCSEFMRLPLGFIPLSVSSLTSYAHFFVNEDFSARKWAISNHSKGSLLKKITPHSHPCTEVYSPSLRGASYLIGGKLND